MLVSVMGSQGSGKSTVINELAKQGFNVIKRKTSRSILTDWGVSLQEVNNNPELTTKFQEEIIKRKFDDELFAHESDELWFTERSFIDLAVYSSVSLGKDNEYSEWLTTYVNRCISSHQTYDLVFYLQAGHFVPEHDGTRGSNHLYSRMVDLFMYDLAEQNTLPERFVRVKTPLFEQRVHQIITLTECKFNSTQN